LLQTLQTGRNNGSVKDGFEKQNQRGGSAKALSRESKDWQGCDVYLVSKVLSTFASFYANC